MTVWCVMLRPFDGEIVVEGALTLPELYRNVRRISLRLRYNPDIRLFTFRAPYGTTRAHVIEAFERLSSIERLKAYQMPQHPLVDRTNDNTNRQS